MSAKQQFSAALKAAKDKRGLTQRQIADGMSQLTESTYNERHVGNWLRGENLPRERLTYLALCRVLYDASALADLNQVNALLATAEQGALHDAERERWFPGDTSLSVGSQTRSESERWYAQVVGTLDRLSNRLGSREQFGTAGAIIFSTTTVLTVWQSPGTSTGSALAVVAMAVTLWVVTTALTVPPGPNEPEERNQLWWDLKLYRLSGVASGVFMAVSMLFWMEGLVELIGGGALPRIAVLPLAAGGLVFAYASGLYVAESFWRGIKKELATRDFYRANARYFAIVMFTAQLSVIAFFHFFQPFWSVMVPLLVLAPAAFMIMWSLRKSTPPPEPIEFELET